MPPAPRGVFSGVGVGVYKILALYNALVECCEIPALLNGPEPPRINLTQKRPWKKGLGALLSQINSLGLGAV